MTSKTDFNSQTKTTEFLSTFSSSPILIRKKVQGKEWIFYSSTQAALNDVQSTIQKTIRIIKKAIAPNFFKLSESIYLTSKKIKTLHTQKQPLDSRKIRRVVSPEAPFDIYALNKDCLEKILKQSIKESSFKPTLYLFSSGGGGHKSAMEALRKKNIVELKNLEKTFIKKLGVFLEDEAAAQAVFKDQFPTSEAFNEFCLSQNLLDSKDVLHDFLGKIGHMSSKKWDDAQKIGDIDQQASIASKQWLANIIFGPAIFAQTLGMLKRNKPEKLVSTQVLATGSILLAVHIYNIFYKPKDRKDLKLDLYMTDLPTKYSGHFFDSIKKTPLFLKRYLRLYSLAPSSEKEGFWKAKCELRNSQVIELEKTQLPVRSSFISALENFSASTFDPEKIRLKVSCEEEFSLLSKRAPNQSWTYASGHKGVCNLDYMIKKEDEALFIMLGSQPTHKAIKDYLRSYIETAKKNTNHQHHMFLFTGQFQDKCFFKSLCLELDALDIPSNLSVIPLSYQSDQELLDLYLHCDTVTRSGGATCFELLVIREIEKLIGLSFKKRLIHTQKRDELKALDSGIPLWEKGNFFFLRQEIGAQITHPKLLEQALFKASDDRE